MGRGGNEATLAVIAVGVAIGVLVGATALWRFPFAMVGAMIGLATGTWLRDNLGSGGVQPPWYSCCCSASQPWDSPAAI